MDVLDRVRKLLALATSPNVHEAAAAAARAQALIAQHRLEAWAAAREAPELDPDPIVDGWAEPLEVARRVRRWKVALAVALADGNGCVAYTASHDGLERIVLVGRGRDRAAVATLFAWLAPRIEWLSATHGAGRSRRWHEAFRVGAVDAVVERLRLGEAEVRAALDSTALAVVDAAARRERAEVDAFVGEHLRLRPGRALRVEARAWERGRAAGEGMELPPR